MGVDIGINVGTCSTNGAFVGRMQSAAAHVVHSESELTSGLTSCLEDGARQLGFASARQMLRQTDSVIISAPAGGTVALAKRSGPKMGLLVSKGLKEEILSGWNSDPAAMGAVVHGEMFESIDEEIDLTGEAIREPHADDVREAVRRLLERGAEAIVVGLRRSPLNPAHETKIREMIEREYPAHYLGAVPVVLSVDHGATLDDGLRTRAALLNAYCTSGTANLLHETEDVLRDRGFTGVVRVLDAEGGTARVCKCIPIACIGSDLAADRYVAASIAAQRGLKNAVILDMGASETRIGCTDGESALSAASPLAADFRHVGLGSHSVLTAGYGRVVVGPKLSRPACYGLGDEDATLTDAFVVLGLLNPDDFAGGSERNGSDAARRVIESELASRMGVSPRDAARLAVTQAVQSIATVLRDVVSLREMDGTDVSLLALGGASGVICCDAARELGIKEVYSPPAGWASSALGGLLAPVQHTYFAYAERTFAVNPSAPDCEWYNGVVRRLEEQAVCGMRGEGLSSEDLSFNLRLEVDLGGASAMFAVPRSLSGPEDLKKLHSAFGDRAISKAPGAGLSIRSFSLLAAGRKPLRELYKFETAGPIQGADSGSATDDLASALVARREAVLGGTPTTVDVFRRESLQPGGIIVGPALIESRGDTFVVPDDMTFAVDGLLGGTISRSRAVAAHDALNAQVCA